MAFIKSRFVPTTFIGLLVLIVIGILGFPGYTVCLLVSVSGLHTVGENVWTDSNTSEDQARYTSLIQAAQSRITSLFGALESKPIIVFFNNASKIGTFKLNEYGSTQLIGHRACVMIGPQGQNIDVLAHELMHSELHHRVGPINRLLHIPTWFDEGLAMQVDTRSSYNVASTDTASLNKVRLLETERQFFVTNNQQLTQHYADAKKIVAQWVETIGPQQVYAKLEKLKQGQE